MAQARRAQGSGTIERLSSGKRSQLAPDGQTRVVIWRDSVAMGDDFNAPHEWVLKVPRDAAVAKVAEEILRTHYLARIGGGLATWILEGRLPVAVLAQQWSEPRWVVDPTSPISELCRSGHRAHFEVRYWCQVDPERVFASLMSGAPLPDRYGR